MSHTITLLYHLTIPRPLCALFPTPGELKEYLIAQGVWPAQVVAERWRLGTATPGYEVELEVQVPLPQAVPQGAQG